MQRSIYYGLVCLWIFLVLCVSAQPVYAYVDPGAGLLLFQVAGSTFAGFMFLIRKKIRNAIARLFGPKRESPSDIPH